MRCICCSPHRSCPTALSRRAMKSPTRRSSPPCGAPACASPSSASSGRASCLATRKHHRARRGRRAHRKRLVAAEAHLARQGDAVRPHLRVGQAARRLRQRSPRRDRAGRSLRRLCPEFGAVRRRLRKAVRRPSLDLRRPQCRASLGRGECRLPQAAFSSACCFAARRRLLKTMEERLCRQARFVFTLAEEDRAALGVASRRPLGGAAAGDQPRRRRRERPAQHRLRRGADRHLDLAAEPHRPRLVPGKGRAASPAGFSHQDRRQHAVRRRLDASGCRIRRPRAGRAGLRARRRRHSADQHAPAAACS